MTFGICRAVIILLILSVAWINNSAAAHFLQPNSPNTPLEPQAPNRPDGNPQPASPEWRWRLTGTLVGSASPIAIFATLGETRSLQEGEKIDGWTLTKISPGAVILTRIHSRRILTLEGFSEEEAAEVARQQAEEAARREANVENDLAKQDQEIAASNDALLAATKQMQAAETPN
jgi:hypothetical protein